MVVYKYMVVLFISIDLTRTDQKISILTNTKNYFFLSITSYFYFEATKLLFESRSNYTSLLF